MGHAEKSAGLAERIAAHFADSAKLKLAAAQPLAAPIARAIELMCGALRASGKILACGNGGSAADAQQRPDFCRRRVAITGEGRLLHQEAQARQALLGLCMGCRKQQPGRHEAIQ